jgi:hypothetical protein
MLGPFLRELLKTLVTLSFAGASMFIGAPLAILGFYGIFGLFPFPSHFDGAVLGLLALGAAGFIWWGAAMWLAWCGGRFRRFTLRRLFLGMTLAAIYMCLVAILISRP